MVKEKNLIKNNRLAFSLIELMIVITIIGILASVAVPAYQDYIKRAKVANLMTVFNSAKNQMIEQYQTGNAFQSTLFGGVVVEGIGNANADFMGYDEIAWTWLRHHADGTKAWFALHLDPAVLNLNVDGSNDVSANKNTIHIGLTYDSGSGRVLFYCGTWTVGDVDMKYLPASCQESNIAGIMY